MTRPTALLSPRARRCALTLGLYFKTAMASSTFVRFFLLTVGILLITRDTVVIETPACCATSSMLILFLVTLDTLSDGIADFDLRSLLLDVCRRDVFSDLDHFKTGA